MAKQNIKDPGAHHNSSGALIRRFLPYLAKHKAVLFLDLFCAALTTLCDIFLPKIMSTITNSAMGVGITLTAGIVLNAGAWTHYSYAIRDALASITVPKVEIHISDITKREEFRKTSVTAPSCDRQIYGQGLDGYLQAIDFILEKQIL